MQLTTPIIINKLIQSKQFKWFFMLLITIPCDLIYIGLKAALK